MVGRLAAVVLVCSLAGCVEDAGMVDGCCGPVALPVGVENAGVNGAALHDAVMLWNDAAAPTVLFEAIESGTLPIGWAAVAEGQTPPGVAGVAGIYERDGYVLTCDVVVSSEYAYDHETTTLSIAHELGHCLGLADDPRSLDLGSIMSSPPYPGAAPTAHDVALVLDRGGCSDP